METKEQKIERLKKEYWILKKEMDKIFTRETKLEEKINLLKGIHYQFPKVHIPNKDILYPDSFQIEETELEELKKESLKLFDLWSKVEQQIKELEDVDKRN